MIQSYTFPPVVLTDHTATSGIVNHTNISTSDLLKANQRLITTSIYLSQFQLNVRHIPGKVNYVPDTLSRLPQLNDKDRHNLAHFKDSELNNI
jgi:hypothetical protein